MNGSPGQCVKSPVNGRTAMVDIDRSIACLLQQQELRCWINLQKSSNEKDDVSLASVHTPTSDCALNDHPWQDPTSRHPKFSHEPARPNPGTFCTARSAWDLSIEDRVTECPLMRTSSNHFSRNHSLSLTELLLCKQTLSFIHSPFPLDNGGCKR